MVVVDAPMAHRGDVAYEGDAGLPRILHGEREQLVRGVAKTPLFVSPPGAP